MQQNAMIRSLKNTSTHTLASSSRLRSLVTQLMWTNARVHVSLRASTFRKIQPAAGYAVDMAAFCSALRC